MDKFIDLHMHTFYSDGEYSPDTLVKMAIYKNISTMSITDHDTLEGIKKVNRNDKYIRDSGITIYNGIELSAKVKTGRMHILGYDIDLDNKVLNNKMIEFKNNSTNTTLSLIEQMKKDYNIMFSHEDLKELLNANHNLGRIDVAKLLIKNGYVKTVDEAFTKYMNSSYEKIFHLKKGKLYPECIELIKNANGIPVLAHPKSLKKSNEELISLLEDMIDLGLMGIEVYHSSHTKEEMDYYLELANKYNLLVSGGSDYHGPIAKPNVELGKLKIKQLSIVDYINKRSH